MQTYYECYPCFLRQAIEAARMAGASSEQLREIIQQSLEVLKHMPEHATPPEIGTQVHHIVREVTGDDDPYRQVKQEATSTALAMLPKLRTLLAEAEDPLHTALLLSIVGNVIDFGPNSNYDLWGGVSRVLRQTPAIDDTESLRQSLANVDTLLFIADNAGETVFDRLLIETLSKPVTYVVRGGAVLNDATQKDAYDAGIDQAAEIIDTGARTPGVVLHESSLEFQTRFNSADLILAKGMGNYETLSEVSAPIYFLLQVKCPVIGKDINAKVGDVIIKKTSYE